jgi:hypothetical protein
MSLLAFQQMKFPPYQFHEFPKMLKLKDGTEVIVQNSKEELQTLANDQTTAPPMSADEQQAQIKQMSELILKLQSQIEQVSGADMRNAAGKAAEITAKNTAEAKPSEPASKAATMTVDQLVKG